MSRVVQRWMVLVGVLLWGSVALASEYPDLGFRMMNSSQNPFPLYVDSRNPKPAGIDLTLVEQAVRNAAQAWEDVPCAYTDFDYRGTTTATDLADSFNVAAIWVTSAQDPLYEGALGSFNASAAVPLTYAGALYQCDIVLNAVDYQWGAVDASAPMPANLMDLQTAIMRELGACQGLAYVQTPSTSVMYVNLEPGDRRRTISQHDRDHLCKVAPQTGAVGSPCATGTCSGGLTCESTRAPDGTTVKLCAKACTGSTQGECPAPYTCRDVSGGASKACLPPTQATTLVGKPCANASVCGSGFALCEEEGELPSQNPDWQAGYCTQSCAAGSPACPGGSGCVQVGSERRCLLSCRPGSADCRTGYSCALRPEGHFCLPTCHTNEDCNPGGGTESICRSCDGVCIPRVQSGRTVGEACTADTECIAGTACLRYQGSTTGVCASTCGLTGCLCPFDTTCQPVGTRGERLCVKNCTPKSCPSGLVCTPSGNGSACLPPTSCTTKADCPTGFDCSLLNKCYDPASVAADGGTTCTLCNDAGTTQPPPPPPPTDGGTGGGTTGPGGCGCQGAPASAMAFFAALALLFALRGKRTWPRP
jgi:hypothetical protein